MRKQLNQTWAPSIDAETQKLRTSGTAYVAAFSQSNEGDISPNIQGAFCVNTGQRCDFKTSTCPDAQGKPRNELCIARGPVNESDWESTAIIGYRQFAKVRELLTRNVSYLLEHREAMRSEEVFHVGHSWIDMASVYIQLKETLVKTCKPSRGYAFAAGTESFQLNERRNNGWTGYV